MEVSINFCYWLFSILFAVCPIILSVLYKKEKINKIMANLLLILYVFALILGVFSSAEKKGGSLIIDFDFSAGWASESISFKFLKNKKFDTVVNLVLLFPVGVILSLFMFYKNKPIKAQISWLFLTGLCGGLFIETMQFVLPIARAIQLSDVIYNMLSCVLGGLYFILIRWIDCKVKTTKRK